MFSYIRLYQVFGFSQLNAVALCYTGVSGCIVSRLHSVCLVPFGCTRFYLDRFGCTWYFVPGIQLRSVILGCSMSYSVLLGCIRLPCSIFFCFVRFYSDCIRLLCVYKCIFGKIVLSTPVLILSPRGVTDPQASRQGTPR